MLEVVRADDATCSLMTRVLRGRPGLDAEYPTVFGPRARGKVVRSVADGRVESACALLVRDLCTPTGSLRVGLIGSVATAEDRRRRGLAAAVLQRAEQELAREGCFAALLLWADDEAFYERRGYARVGCEEDFLLESTTACVALDSDRRVLGVSPDGFLWLSGIPDAQGGYSLETVDPWTAEPVLAAELTNVGAPVSASPRSRTQIGLLTDDSIWAVDDGSVLALSGPSSYGSAAHACGSPRTNGSILSDGFVFERRDNDWWRLDLAPATAESFVRFDGECRGPLDDVWLVDPGNGLVSVGRSGARTWLEVEGVVGASGTDQSVGLVTPDQLWIGPAPWVRWFSDEETFRAVAASNGAFWVTTSTRILRVVGDEFRELAGVASSESQSLLPHLGGLWIIDEREACHHTIGPAFRVSAAESYGRSMAPERPLVVERLSPETELSVELDGDPVELETSTGDLWEATLGLSGIGWHTVDIEAVAGDGTSARQRVWLRLDVPETVSFASEVAPLAAEHCSGAGCHLGAPVEGVPSLATYEDWLAQADNIEERVLERDNMPPSGARLPGWGPDAVAIVERWLTGGMLP